MDQNSCHADCWTCILLGQPIPVSCLRNPKKGPIGLLLQLGAIPYHLCCFVCVQSMNRWIQFFMYHGFMTVFLLGAWCWCFMILTALLQHLDVFTNIFQGLWVPIIREFSLFMRARSTPYIRRILCGWKREEFSTVERLQVLLFLQAP